MYMNLGEAMSPATFTMLRHGKHYEARVGTSNGIKRARFLALDDEHALAFAKEFAEKVAGKIGQNVKSIVVVELQERPVLIKETAE